MEDKFIEAMQTLENCVKINFFRERRGWTMAQIAYELNFNLQRMMEWVNSRGTAIAQIMKQDPAVSKRIMIQMDEEYPLEPVKEEKKLKVDVNKAVKFLKEGLSLMEIAKKFRCNYNLYRIWHNDNLKLINQRMKNI